MNQLKIKDFSNIYSPKNKIFINNLPKTLNNRSKLQPPSTLTSRRQTSTSPQFVRRSISPRILNVPKISEFKVKNKIKLGKQKLDQIQYLLEIDAQAQRNFQEREAKQNFFIEYDFNPLSQRFSKKKKQGDKKEKQQKQENPKTPNLLQALTKNKDKNYIGALKQKIQKTQSLSLTLLNKIEKQRNKKEYQQTKNKRLVKIQKQQKDEYEQLRIQNSGINQLYDIIKIKQESYFRMKRQRQNFNIFEVIKKTGKSMFKSGRQQLLQCYFNFDSMYNNSSSSVTENFVRDLSTYSRIAIINPFSKLIPQDHKMKSINKYFEDSQQTANCKLYLAKGLILPEVLKVFFNEQTDIVRKNSISQLLSESLDQEIFYKDDQQQKLTSYFGQSLQEAEVSYYQKEQLSKLQNKQIELSTNYFQKLKKIVKKQRNFIDNSIFDQKLLSRFQQLKERVLCQQLDTNVGLQPGEQTDRKIRRNKMNKNRAEKLKNMIVLNTFKVRKQTDKALKQAKKMHKQKKQKQ